MRSNSYFVLFTLLVVVLCCAVFTSSQLTGGYQGEKNGSSVTSVCLCLFTTCPIPSQSSSSDLVAIHTRFLQCCWNGSTVVVLFPFILIDGLLPSRCRKRKKTTLSATTRPLNCQSDRCMQPGSRPLH